MGDKREVSLFIEDILERIQKIEEYSAIYLKKKLRSILKQDAIFRRLEIIGEAV